MNKSAASLVEDFRFEYKYEIEYENDFSILDLQDSHICLMP